MDEILNGQLMIRERFTEFAEKGFTSIEVTIMHGLPVNYTFVISHKDVIAAILKVVQADEIGAKGKEAKK